MTSLPIVLTLEEAEELATGALVEAGASRLNASSAALALAAAEADDQPGHGLARVSGYAEQIRAGKIDGRAAPKLVRSGPAVLRIDANWGLAYPALDLANQALPALAREAGCAAAGVYASHHIGQAGRTVERLAEAGLLGVIFSNTPKAMSFFGGTHPMMGTNPLAFAAPVPGRAPLVIDMALTVVARSRIVRAQKHREVIPPDWAFDAEGRPTQDPKAALQGSLAPIGGAKGAALALMLEVVCAALVGGNFGWEASSFLDAEGAPPGVGQLLLALDPAAFAGAGFAARMTELMSVIAGEPGVRVPGDRRLKARERVATHGLKIPQELHEQLLALQPQQERGGVERPE